MSTKEDLEQMVRNIAAELESVANDTYEYDEQEYSSAMDAYFSDVLDITFTCDTHGYRGVRFAVALGGPNIYVDQSEGCIRGCWGLDHYEWGITSNACDALYDYGAELFEVLYRHN